MITAQDRYDEDPDLTQFYQGDVIKKLPFPKWPTFETATGQTKWAILRPMNQGQRSLEESLRSLPNDLIGRAAKDVPDAFLDSKIEMIMASCQLADVMIVSRSCALDNPSRKHFLTAPVTSIDSLPLDQKSDGKLAALRNGEIPHFFYLPGRDGYPESLVDLLKITPIHRTFFRVEDLKQSLGIRLSSMGTLALQHTLAFHFGLKFGFSLNDVCRQDGQYRCANCFFAGNGVQIKFFKSGQTFGDCPNCGEDASYVKLSNG